MGKEKRGTELTSTPEAAGPGAAKSDTNQAPGTWDALRDDDGVPRVWLSFSHFSLFSLFVGSKEASRGMRARGVKTPGQVDGQVDQQEMQVLPPTRSWL